MKNLSSYRSTRGVGLVELCIFIIAVGVIFAVAMPLYHTYETNKHADVTSANIAQVQQALDAFFLKNGYFPRPSNITVKADAANFGKAGAATPPIDRGAVPTRTLGLPDSAGMDGWSHHLVYALTDAYATVGQKNMMNGQIHVVDSLLTQNATKALLVYIIVPANPDGSGAYDMQGKMVRTCAGEKPGSLALKLCTLFTSPAAGTAAMPYISTMFQQGQGAKMLSNVAAFKGDYCASGAPVGGACGTQATTGLFNAYPAPPSSVTSSSPTLCQPNPGIVSAFVTLPAGATVATNGQWSWVCNGSCGAGNVACNVSLCQPVAATCIPHIPTPAPPGPLTSICGSAVPGVYGNLTGGANANAAGVINKVGTAASGGTWEWQCLGNCQTNPDTEQLVVPSSPTQCANNAACRGATSPTCSSYICQPVNGACGPDNGKTFTSAPSGAGLCAAGPPASIATAVSGAGTKTYTWKCKPPNPACRGTNCATGGAPCLGTVTASCSATCVNNGVCTLAKLACGGNSCTDNCGVTYTSGACPPPPPPPNPTCSNYNGAIWVTNDAGVAVLAVSVKQFVSYGGNLAAWAQPSNAALSFSNTGGNADTWVHCSCAFTDHNGFCPGNTGQGWCPYVAIHCNSPMTMDYMLSPTGPFPRCAGP